MNEPGPNATQEELAAWYRYWRSSAYAQHKQAERDELRRILVRDGLLTDNEISALAPLLPSRTPSALRIKQRKRRWQAREEAYDYTKN